MNLIYSLACEAGLIKFESVHDSMAVTPSLESVAKAQKFADLLIKECMKLNHEHFNDEDPYSIDSVYRQHFGVQQ